MRKNFFLIAILFLLVGCIREPTPKGYLNIYNQNMNKAFNLVYQQSKKCYEKDWSLFSDGIAVKAHDGNQITFHRFAPDIGLTEPFIILDFKNNKIEVTEGTYECGLSGCKELNIKRSIRYWLQRHSDCLNKK